MQRQTTLATTASANANKNWYIVDATDIPLGRLASKIAVILMGKDKPTYTPNIDTGDYVIVVNASKVKLTGKNGGEHTRSAGVMLREFPVELIERAVWGMLPKGRLGRQIAKKLFVYEGAEHKQQSQQPKVLDLSK